MQQLQRDLQEQSSKCMRAVAQKERLESLARALRKEVEQLKLGQPEPQCKSSANGESHANGDGYQPDALKVCQPMDSLD